MKNTSETKNEEVLRELRKVEEFTEGRIYKPGNINVHQMAKDSADVIEDLNEEIRVLRDELAVKEWIIGNLYREWKERKNEHVAINHEENEAIQDAIKQLEELRGGINE